MIALDDLRLYLPKYLSEEHYENLISQLRDFPENIDKRMFASGLEKNIIYQGDGIKDMPIVSIEDLSLGVKYRPCMVFSNTCDMDLANTRLFPTMILYSPIVEIEKYVRILEQNGISADKINNHLADVRAQKVSTAYYIPSVGDLGESIIFFDRILNVSQRYIDRDTYADRRLFSLSNYGFYLLVFKLSIHFSRIREGVNRG